MFPYPIIDEKLSATGTECEKCGKQCVGHYVTDLTEYVKLFSEGKAIRALPPSQIIKEFHMNNKDVSHSDAEIDKLARRCLLSPDDVKIWLDHLKQVDQNRKQGAEKAKVTRQKNKRKKAT